MSHGSAIEATATRSSRFGFREFMRLESAGGVCLLGATIAALVLRNSPLGDTVADFWHQHALVTVGPISLDESLTHWINDGLMAIFFFVAGIEIKRELVVGELRDLRRAALPAIAVLVIAVFYSASISFTWLGVVAGLIAVVILMRRADVWFVPAYVVVGVSLWVAMLESGVHATLAGVVLGLMTPAVARRPSPTTIDVAPSIPLGVLREVLTDARETVPVTDRLLHILHPWTAFVILPLFALANGGVALSVGGIADAATSPVTIGIVLGLVAGKCIGIVVATRLAVIAGIGELPENVTWRSITGVALLGGIGFTVSLFITGLAFADGPMQDASKLGVLAASAIAAAAGAMVLRRESRRLASATSAKSAVTGRPRARSELLEA